MSGGRKYQFEAVPAGAEFEVDILIENGSPAELGLAWLGLRATEQGMIGLGGARSRGLGYCRFVPDWKVCRYVNSESLISYLFEEGIAAEGGNVWRERMVGWVAAFKEAIGMAGEGAQ